MIKNNNERQINGELGPKRAAILAEIGDDAEAIVIISDVNGTELDFWRFGDENKKNKELTIFRYEGNDFQTLEVGVWVIFYKPRVISSKITAGDS